MNYHLNYIKPHRTDSMRDFFVPLKNYRELPTLEYRNEGVSKKFLNKTLKHLVAMLAFSICTLISFAQSKVQKQNECDCKGSSYSPYDDWPLLAIGDSVAICKSGTISFGSNERNLGYVDFLKRHSLSQGKEKIILCKAGKIVQNDYGEYSLSYQKKQLIITWNIVIDSFLVDKINGLQIFIFGL